MGLPSGVLWAPCNIDVDRPNGFAKSPFQYDCSYFSWGNVDAHNPTGPASFEPWSFGNANNQEPYVSSPGATITYPESADLDHDAARVCCGAPWRLPTPDDFVELIDNIDFIDANGDIIEGNNKLTTYKNIVGIRLRSRLNGATLFFAACGRGYLTQRNNSGLVGNYWTSSLGSQEDGRNLTFYSEGVIAASGNKRFYGFPCRPVMQL